jgi:hypothetical protein
MDTDENPEELISFSVLSNLIRILQPVSMNSPSISTQAISGCMIKPIPNYYSFFH